MLLAIHGLFKNNLVEWVSSMTYQAASGAGAQNMKELLMQMGELSGSLNNIKPDSNILELDKDVQLTMNSEKFTKKLFTAPLAGSLIPWIDEELENGQSREEWKGSVETNKILKSNGYKAFNVDGLCVRIGAMRSHSQALTIKLNKDLPIKEIEELIASANPWVHFVPNNKEKTIKNLSPAAVSGKLSIAVGRVRKLNVGENLLSVKEEGLLGNAMKQGQLIVSLLNNEFEHNDKIISIRHMGLMIGIELKNPCAALVELAMNNKLLINVTSDKTIRLLPPLIMNNDEAKLVARKLIKTIDEFLKKT